MENGNNQAEPDTTVTADVEIARVLESHRGEHHVIVVQDFPDPDAISSAFAHQVISAEFGIEADIVYGKRISHQENIALVRLLGIDLVRYEPSQDMAAYDGSVFVDNQGTTSSQIVEVLQHAEVPVLVVVDHHEQQGVLEPEFADIRRTGSTATIYAEYLEGGLMEAAGASRNHTIVATALMHGIMSDTGHFIRAEAPDFMAAAFLSQYTDDEILEQILSQARSRQTMDVIRRALGNRVAAENFSIAGVGYLRAEDRDAIPQTADFLLTEENIHTSIVYGIVIGDGRHESLIGSVRTSKITIDPDEFIKDVFGKDVRGQYFGGGKPAAGAFEIPIGFLSGEASPEYRDLKWDVYDTQIKQRLFAKIGFLQESRES
jgi:nanoRNase/pAp phosphatase (c-di-AMP/oligoRNAs hydrolase)